MSIERKLKRDSQKRQYKKFCEQWSKAKTEQHIKLNVLGASLDKDERKLGRKPTFVEWKDIHARLEREFKARKAAEEKEKLELVDPKDLEWEEEGATK